MRDHAVVIGGSMAGLLAARVLADHFAVVSVVERDTVPDSPQHRKGTPQDRHLHAFWSAGLQAAERLLPGLGGDLLAAGAHSLNLPEDMLWLMSSGRWSRRFPATQSMLSSTRTLLEWAVRRRVTRWPGVRLLADHIADGLRMNAAGDIAGVELHRRGGAAFVLDADLVVDATGRGSMLPSWLGALGRTAAKEATVDAFLGYATRTYEMPRSGNADFSAIYVTATPPACCRGGVLTTVEGNLWTVTLTGGGRDYPPTDERGFLEFARSLRSPVLADVIADAQPASPIWGNRRTANRRRYYERLPDLPARLLVMGDSLCAFNPVYGQGMTVAALQAEILKAQLTADAGELPHVIRRAQKELARVADGAWLLATLEDLRYPTTEGAKPTLMTRMSHRYMDRLIATAADDAIVNAAFLRVLTMLDAPGALFKPAVMRRVLAGGTAQLAADAEGVPVRPAA